VTLAWSLKERRQRRQLLGCSPARRIHRKASVGKPEVDALAEDVVVAPNV